MIRKAAPSDAAVLAALAARLWPHDALEELEREFEALARNESAACFLAYAENRPVGFAQCALRFDYVEGTETSPVGYLEGIYVMEGCRKRGYARALLSACEAWAGERGCAEFASDCELDNLDSFRFHMAVGFEETNRVICFKKSLPE